MIIQNGVEIKINKRGEKLVALILKGGPLDGTIKFVSSNIKTFSQGITWEEASHYKKTNDIVNGKIVFEFVK